LKMESTPSSGAFTGATLAEKLNKLNASQQSIESILARLWELYCHYVGCHLLGRFTFLMLSSQAEGWLGR
jgi:hypothetical protein